MVFARVARFSFDPGKHAQAEALSRDLTPRISALPGCHAVHFFGDEADGEYGLFVLWASQEDADAAATVIGPQLSAHLQGNVKDAPDIRLFEVLPG
jgi:quinol monooxygenase YgiN